MRKSFWDKKIPTLFGLLMILFGTIVTTYFVSGKQIVNVNAGGSNQPNDVRITNVTDNSFSVSFITENKTSGTINYGKDKNLGQSALDERDQAKGGLNQYEIHSITAKNLEPSTKYYFSIISGGQTYTTSGQLFEVSTATSIASTDQAENFIKGRIINANGSPVSEAIIYITSDNLQVASFLVDQNGEYNFQLTNLRTSDLSSFYKFLETQIIKMLVVGIDAKSTASVSFSAVKNVPTITLSKDYDFSIKNTDTSTSSAQLGLQSLPVFETNSSTVSANSIKILTPSKNENLSDQQPDFKGVAIPNQTVQITIHSDEQIKASVKADSSGNWSFTPNTPLSPGNHTITVTTKNSAGILQTITQSFVVFAQEISITPTPTEVIIASSSPTPTVISTTSAITNELPQTGNTAIITFGIIGIIISIAGGLLFLLTRGGI